ncbi:SET domain-containing protein SmydA-8 [Melitaea cinxia]|uniref:SET domain-containing protein SmydA-8 n=1 Tax=Melitaea cinxia TaxID=113334 RepID=UPI001E26F886|nr:SET domain-containing protein SmydA-8 [Melitaea cinxia]XP_045451338.1 SET domain-containing protein SmydA-8 [Melitaea cinxia]
MDYIKREIPVCEVCQKPASQTCGGCKLVYYCSRAHQKLGWKEGHKSKCCGYKIQYSEELGRHMVATRDIQQGEIILREKPAAIGPKISCKPHCLSCGLKLEPIQKDDELDFYKCSSCNWPMCGVDCEKAEVHREECKIMTKRNYKCKIKYESSDKQEAAYCIIAPMRVLLMKQTNPRQFESIMSLESHLEDRINTPLYLVLKANLVTFIIQVLGLSFDEETILKVSSIFDTNSFDVRSPDGSKRLRAIYVTASMMNHNCRPNTRHIYLGDDNTLTLIATVPILKGEMITATYTQSLYGTLDRRKLLKTHKCFNCECDRCKDPTEFGTYLGNIYCSVCNSASLESSSEKRGMLVSTNPLDETAPWHCEKCGYYIQSRQMFWGNNALKQELNTLNKSGPRCFEEFIDKYKATLHPTNHLAIQAKLALVQIYGNYEGYTLADLPDHLIKRKIDLCHDLLDVADKLEPGWSRFRGTILLELQSAMTMQTKREFEDDIITKSAAQDQLMESMVLLQEAANILRIEPHMKTVLETKVQELSNLLDNTNL